MGCHVAVFDDVIQLFSDMKVCKSSTLEKAKKRKKLLPFCLSEYKKNIILAEANKILVINVDQTIDDPYTTFVKMLTGKDCPTPPMMPPRTARRRTWCLSSGPLSLHPLRAK